MCSGEMPVSGEGGSNCSRVQLQSPQSSPMQTLPLMKSSAAMQVRSGLKMKTCIKGLETVTEGVGTGVTVSVGFSVMTSGMVVSDRLGWGEGRRHAGRQDTARAASRSKLHAWRPPAGENSPAGLIVHKMRMDL